MKIVITGPPGSGKGTYSKRMSQEFGIPHINIGNLLREEIEKGTERGNKIADKINDGNLATPEIVEEMLDERLSKDDCSSGFILDGYPRTLEQARNLKDRVELDAVIWLNVSKDVIVKRLSKRRVCEECGELYHLENIPPEEDGLCDKCHGKLYQREDDKPDSIEKRLKVFKRKTEDVLEYYEDDNNCPLIVIDDYNDRDVEDVVNEITHKLKEKAVQDRMYVGCINCGDFALVASNSLIEHCPACGSEDIQKEKTKYKFDSKKEAEGLTCDDCGNFKVIGNRNYIYCVNCGKKIED